MPNSDEAPRPNIVLIMTDQQRGDCLGCDGHPVLETPNLDQLASEGTRFRNAYSAVPSCLPARASLLTGADQWHTGILGMGRGQKPLHDCFVHTLPGELGAVGYHTQAIGKNHFLPQRALNGYHNCVLDESGRVKDPGFVSDYRAWFEDHKTGPYGYNDHSIGWNSWNSRPTHLPEHLHPTWWTAQQAIDWLGRRDPNKPFFLKMSFARPHSPYDPPQVYYDMYKDRRMPDPYLGEWSAMHDDPHTAAQVSAWRGKRTDAEIQRARACYYGSVTFIDHQIGRFIDAFGRRDRPARNNTLFIFLSDHGDMLGDHHMWRKTYAYEGSARVPMLVRLPRSWEGRAHQVRDEVVEMRDVMPTVLETAGAPIPDTVTGKSMVPLARGQTPAWREYLHGEHSMGYGLEQAMHYLTDGREKYIYFPYLGTEQLFNLEEDPGETQDLSQEAGAADRLKQWRQRLIDELAPRGEQFVRDGRLARLGPDEVQVSPHYMSYNAPEDGSSTHTR